MDSSDLDEERSERCYHCFRPAELCFCDAIPRIDNRTNVLILQHVGERFHPFNTARIVQRSLSNCRLIVDHNLRLGARDLPIQRDAALLYRNRIPAPL
ncbi:MAG: DTW domain-containing protein [Planctomycetales bacterium]|nr:DTW domain-containing protein [Planctomycetales bacterium]